ncbi:hypothetical protein Pryu01_00886 [Paraliobacillus ryukyuensis]|uniref:ATP synthase protein I n=1 Tax=Paraliobacillus ryukyuensis TaxID=200904 RepID=A0A366EDQ7_9BACI|nr:ATP synthase subunit I [Paraliobacillus ryukyuensis]RBP00541.1 ATP synthase protein I [Paraliobacillus ryukyuensis]
MSLSDYDALSARQKKWMLYYLSLLVVAAILTRYHTFFTGLTLGTVFSFYNLWLMHRKVQKFGDAIQHGEKMFGLGTFSRFASAVLGVLIALELPAYFDVFGVIFGLLTMYVVMIIDFIVDTRRLNMKEKR